jgi:hypothetical protein
MRNIVIIIFFLLFPFSAYAHPGRTDYRGGHKCWKNCTEWELKTGEYHLHDKDWKPIRLDKKGNPIKQILPEQTPTAVPKDRTEPAQPYEINKALPAEENKAPETAEPEKIIIREQVHKTVVYEESILPFNCILLLILAVLLAVLLLLALIFIRKKREKG